MEKENKNDERRRDVRVDVRIWAKEKSERGVYFHLLSNLSRSGFFIEKKLPFSVGSTVHLKLQLSDFGKELTVKGLVVNNYKDPDSNIIGAGVKFIDMDEEIEEKIETYLNLIKKDTD